MNSITIEEGASKSLEEVDPELQEERDRRDAEAHDTLVNKAQQDLDDEKRKPAMDLRPTGISDQDLKFLRQIFPDKIDKGKLKVNIIYQILTPAY